MMFRESGEDFSQEGREEVSKREASRNLLNKEEKFVRERRSSKSKRAALMFLGISFWAFAKQGLAFENEQLAFSNTVHQVLTEREFPKYELNWQDSNVQESWEKELIKRGLRPEGGAFRQSPFGASEAYNRYVDAYGNTIYELVKVREVLEKIKGAKLSQVIGIRDAAGKLVALFASGKKAFVPFSDRFINPQKDLDEETAGRLRDYFDEIKSRAQEESQEGEVTKVY